MSARDKITPKQCAFAHYYVETGNASEAYRRAYNSQAMKPETVWRNANALLKNNKVATRVEELQAALAEKHGVTVGRIVNELCKLAFSDIRKAIQWDANGKLSLVASDALDDHTAAAVTEVRQTATGLNIKFADKRSSLVELGKHLGMFKDQPEQTDKADNPTSPNRVMTLDDARRVAYLLFKSPAVEAAASKDCTTSQAAVLIEAKKGN